MYSSRMSLVLLNNSCSFLRCLPSANVICGRLISSSKTLSISSKEILEKERKMLANTYNVLPVVLAKAEGAYLWDLEGKKYIDFFAAYATCNQGHCHPKIVATLREQAGILHHSSRSISHNTLYPLLERLTSLFGYDQVYLANTGVEGGEAAVKLARRWGYRIKKIPDNQAGIIFAEGNFWGRTLAAISSSTSPTSTEQFGPFMPGYHLVPYNNIEKLEEKLKDPNICAFMVEPVQGEAGVIVPDPGYLKEVRRLCTKYNVLWIADEVQTGLARTGKLLAVDHEDVKPDILILGKALSGGLYPVSAILANDEVMNCFTPGSQGSTYGGNPLACRVALTAINVLLEENLAERAEKSGEIFRTELLSRLKSDRIETVRGKGLLNAVVFKAGVFQAADVSYKLKDNGLIAKHMADNILRISPPLVISEQDLRKGIDIIVDIVNDMPLNP